MFVKTFYPDYIVFIKHRDKLITYDYDLKIIKNIGSNNILNVNYLILDNVNITEKKEFNDNNYYYYYNVGLLLEIISGIKSKL